MKIIWSYAISMSLMFMLGILIMTLLGAGQVHLEKDEYFARLDNLTSYHNPTEVEFLVSINISDVIVEKDQIHIGNESMATWENGIQTFYYPEDFDFYDCDRISLVFENPLTSMGNTTIDTSIYWILTRTHLIDGVDWLQTGKDIGEIVFFKVEPINEYDNCIRYEIHLNPLWLEDNNVSFENECGCVWERIS